MANFFIQMVDQVDNVDPFRYAEALYTKLLAVDNDPEESRKTAREMISTLEQIDEPRKCSHYAIDPKCHSDNAKNLMSIAYEKLGWQAFIEGVRAKDDDEKSSKLRLAIKHYEKYKDLSKSVGNMVHVRDAETKIARSKSGDPLEKSEVKQNLPLLRATFAKDPSSLNCSNLVFALRSEGHEIELERIMAKQILEGRQVLGPDHPSTLEMETGLKGMSVRHLKPLDKKDKDDSVHSYRFVRYENNDAKCIISPMANAHDFEGGNSYEEGKEFAIDTDQFQAKFRLATAGTPVMLQGLQSQKATHLNGKIGDARKYNKDTKRYEVHFEDKTLVPRSASVKMANLRILTDLPPIA